MSKKLPKSLRIFIRREKTRIHREVSDTKEQGKLINELYQKLAKPSKTSSVGLSKKKPDVAKRVKIALPVRKSAPR